MSQRVLWLVVVTGVVLFSAVFAFSSGFDNGFAHDDLDQLERAFKARSLPAVLLQRWVEPFNRPLGQLAFYLESRLFGLDAGRYVLAHTLLHVLNGVLLFWLLQGPLGPQTAAAAAVLFGLGFGFYGKSVLVASDLPDLWTTSFVLGTGIAALRAQLARQAGRRALWMGLAATLFTLGLLCKESGMAAVVMVAGLMWPHRRSLGSVARKLGLLMGVLGLYLAWQIVSNTGLATIALDPQTWIALPGRVFQLISYMVIPVFPIPETSPLLFQMATVLEQLRVLLGAVLVVLGIVWFVRGPGAVRWLLASELAFILPFGLIALPESWLDIRFAYLPATCFCGLLAYALRSLWLRAGTRVKAVLAVLIFLGITGQMTIQRHLESRYDTAAQSEDIESRIEKLRGLQKSAPKETLEPRDRRPVPVS